jgi:hypothetical protein
MTLNTSRRRALNILWRAPIEPVSLLILGLREKALDALCEMGFAKYRPYAKPASWAITQAGRDYLKGKS